MAQGVPVMLVFPPPWLPVQPYIALPALQGALRNAGLAPVVLYDLNVHVWNEIFSGAHLANCLERARSRRPADPDESYARALLTGPYASLHADEARSILRDPERFFDYPRFAWSIRVLMEAMQLVAAAYRPTVWNYNRFEMRYRYELEDLERATEDREENPFLEYFEREALPRIEAAAPRVLGISISCQEQAIPGLTLAALVRRRLPRTVIAIGGAHFSALVKEIHANPGLFRYTDYFVVNEGESAIVGLVRAVLEDREPRDVPNLVRLGPGGVETTPFALEDAASLPPPDYDGLPWDLYFSPHPVFHLQTSRGCYWNRCTFCAQTRVISENRYRQRAPDAIVADVRSLVDRHGARHFTFWDDSMAPALLRRMSLAILEAGLEIRWTAISRFESAFLTGDVLREMYRAGCRQIEFGFESSVPRVLSLMDKGTDPELFTPVLEQARAAGLSTSLLAMVGFPGETREDAEASLRFLLERSHLFNHVYWSHFVLAKHSEVEKDPGRFGLSPRVGAGSLSVRFRWERLPGSEGMDPEESAEMARVASQRCDEAGITDTNPRTGAHYLLYQDRAGAEPPVYADRAPALEPEELGRVRLVRAEGLLMGGGSFAFNPKNARTVRIPPAVADLLEFCATARHVRQILEHVAIGDEEDSLESAVLATIGKLVQFGILVRVSESNASYRLPR